MPNHLHKTKKVSGQTLLSIEKKSARHSTRKTATSVSAKKRQASIERSEAFPIPLTNPDRQVDEESKLTKRELAEYFWAVRKHLLPHVLNRPLSIVRCPRGSTKPCFYQKHVTGSLPEGIDGIDVRERESGEMEAYLTLSSPVGLAGLAQMGVVEIHPWGSSNHDIEKPDRLVFDLDPDEAIDWATLAQSAKEVRAFLKQLGLESFLKTTGGKGLHVVAPIEPEHDWPVVKTFALGIAKTIEERNPDLYLTKMTKAARKGKIYIDYLRNERGATSIAPYSPRARHGAPVAVPLRWEELGSAKPPRFLVAKFSEWKTRLRHDPWKAMIELRQSIPEDVLAKFTSGQATGSGRSKRKN